MLGAADGDGAPVRQWHRAAMGVIAEQLGHADTRMTEKHYAHLAPSYVADTIRAHFPTLGIGISDKLAPLKRGDKSAPRSKQWARAALKLYHLARDEVERASSQRYREAMKRKPKDSDFRTKMNARAAKRHVELITARRGIFDEDTRAEAEAAWDKAREEAKVMFKRLVGKAN